MNFEFNDEQKMLRETVRKFAQKEVEPISEEIDEKDEFSFKLFRRMGELGFLGLPFSQTYGGSEAGAIGACIFTEEMAKANSGVAAGAMAHVNLALMPVYVFGTEEQKKKYLVPGIKGEKIGAFGLTEPYAGSDVQGIRTTAVKKNGKYIINGSKTFITNGSVADFVLVAAYTDKSKKSNGISVIIVDKGTKGFKVGRKLKKLGWHASDTAELSFEDCVVPEENLLGAEGTGFMNLMKTLHIGRINISAFAVGLAEAAFEKALEYAKERVAFGQPIGKFQAIRFKLSRMITEIEAARTLVYRSAWLADNGREDKKLTSITKLKSSEVCQWVTREAIQIFGGYGFMMEYPLQRYFRDSMIFTIGEGTSEIHEEIIARELGL
jgi:alkylation response protein AidB-like acyl-CoA dehydrogenase